VILFEGQHDTFTKFLFLLRLNLRVFNTTTLICEAPGGSVVWGTALQAGRTRIRFPIVTVWHNPSGRTLALGSTEPLTEMISRNVSLVMRGGGEKRLGWQF
jgi:hypothetical protein